MFEQLASINERPAVFSRHTTAELWTDPHISQQMLRYHLDGSVAISSETAEFIDAATTWLAGRFRLGPGRDILDLGCGPGLYTGRLARTGARVTGLDFSARSIDWAREAAARDGLAVRYILADYLAWQPDATFDLVTMIMRDYCALDAGRRLALLQKVEGLLKPEGAFVFDVDSVAAFGKHEESASYTPLPEGGFWSAEPCFEFHNAWVYPDEAVSLDRFTIVEAGRTRTVYNWIQFFSPESLAAELASAGLVVESRLGDVAGRAFDPGASQFAVVARRASAPKGS